jgi:hypothetical protein
MVVAGSVRTGDRIRSRLGIAETCFPTAVHPAPTPARGFDLERRTKSVELEGRGAAKVCYGGGFKTDASSTANVRSADASRMLHCDRNPTWIFSIFIRFFGRGVVEGETQRNIERGNPPVLPDQFHDLGGLYEA